ncbi:MAG: glycosyl transferase [Flavobacteriaceae bacterium]
MKVIKELPLSIYQSIRLASIPRSKLIRMKREELPVIISLTSIPSRFRTLHLVIRSLFTQTHHPKKIVLWLNNEIKSQVPRKILNLQCELFEICYSDLNCSHRKLIHSLDKYPDDVIITCDDDLMYRNNWLYLLYKNHKSSPNCIIGNRTIYINYDSPEKPAPYKLWKFPDQEDINQKAIIPIGAWGILYPPNSLNKQVLDSGLFLRLAPQSDDFWFKAMALLNGTLSVQADVIPKEPIPIAGTQKGALKKTNINQNKNDVQWNALSEYFNLYPLITK